MIARPQIEVKDDSQILRIPTPEHLELEFRLAGIGSRFLAYFLDKCIQFGFVAVVLLMVNLVVIAVADLTVLGRGMKRLQDVLPQWIIAAGILFYGTVFIGYFILFEYFWSGSTPGKRWQNIRVIRKDGRPITLIEAGVRNILRFVDILGEVYPIGLIVMFLDRRNRRLGDLAAGTLVVIDRPPEQTFASVLPPGPDVTDSEIRSAVARMTLEDYRLVSKFLARRDGLEPAPRRELAQEIFERVLWRIPRTGNAKEDPEQVLETLTALYREKTRIL